MAKVLIAYNNDAETILHDFFESCADEAKQICIDNGVDFSSVCPPNLNEENVVGRMCEHQFCFVVTHGDANGLYNETGEAIVSTQTTNYNFKDKAFYSIGCSCAQNLYPELKKIGLLFFVGYNDTFNVRGNQEPFLISAIEGLKSFLSGSDLKTAKEQMLNTFDEQISMLDEVDPWAAVELAHNKEALIFEGDDSMLMTTLQ